MQWLSQNSEHVALAVTLATLVLSELLPFLPTKANGVAQAVINVLKAFGGLFKKKVP